MAEILITSEYFCKFSGKAKRMLLDAGHIVIDNPYGHTFLSPELIIPHIASADAIICDLEKINSEVLAAAKNLKLIARRGVGVDSVDLQMCNKRDITVARTPGLVEKPVAELVMAYMLQHSRKTDILSADMHGGKWHKVIGNSLFGKTLGILGLGNIARETVKRAKCFDMNVIYYDVNRNEVRDKEMGVSYAEFYEVLSGSDFISIHLPLLPETENLINYETIKRMKKTAFIINTARGKIIDEAGLKRAMDERLISGAAIDVFDVEPKEDSVLRNCPGIILTPHVATFTVETFIAMDERCAENIIEYFSYGKRALAGVVSSVSNVV